jgi:hypothetical protein
MEERPFPRASKPVPPALEAWAWCEERGLISSCWGLGAVPMVQLRSNEGVFLCEPGAAAADEGDLARLGVLGVGGPWA